MKSRRSDRPDRERKRALPGPTPRSLFTLSDSHRSLLEQIARRPTAPQRLVRRCRIVLASADGHSNERIARDLRLKPDTVRLWRDRWPAIAERLTDMESALLIEGMDERKRERFLDRAFEDALADASRPGTPPTFSPEQIVALVAVALEDPAECGRPVSHWTPRELRDEVIKRGIVGSISERSVGRFLKGGRPQTPSKPLLAEPRDQGSASVRRGGEDRLRSLPGDACLA
jgi:putative transposase